MAGSNFSISFKESDLRALVDSLGASMLEANKAAARAARRTLATVRAAIRRDVAAQLNIPQNKLTTRLIVRPLGVSSWELFFGVNRMPYDKTSNVSQNAFGMAHRTRDIKSGFVDNMGGGTKKGWIRKGRARQLGIDLPGLGSGPAGTGRLPIIRISHDLEEVANPIFERHQKRISSLFLARFEHELKNIKGLTK